MRTTAILKAALLKATLLVAVCCACASSASAQYAPYAGFRYTRPYGYGGYSPYSYYGYGGGTVAGSYATGMGNLIRAQGAYNEQTAQAAVTAQGAYSMALDNRLKAAQTYDELQAMNRQQAAEKKQRDSEIWAKNVPPPKRPRLSASQLDPVTGEINWDPLLLDPKFADYRNKLQLLFTQRAKDPSSVSYYNVSKITGPMRDYLDTMITEYPTNVFFSARHFIEAVAQESRFSGLEPGPTAGASNTPPSANVPRT